MQSKFVPVFIVQHGDIDILISRSLKCMNIIIFLIAYNLNSNIHIEYCNSHKLLNSHYKFFSLSKISLNHAPMSASCSSVAFMNGSSRQLERGTMVNVFSEAAERERENRKSQQCILFSILSFQQISPNDIL